MLADCRLDLECPPLATTLEPSRIIMRQLRAKLDAAALDVLRSGRDWGEGPVNFTSPDMSDAFSTRSLWDPIAIVVEAKGGAVATDWEPPEGWSVVRFAAWDAAGRPGDLQAHECLRCGLRYHEGAHFYDDTCNPCARRAGLEVPKEER
jgi:hypothetical protein